MLAFGRMTEPGEPERWLRQSLTRETDDCIEWPYTDDDGYGALVFGGKKRKATQVALELSGQPRPPAPNNLALHSCDNSACVNLRHLRWGTNRENSSDMVSRGRHRGGGRSGPRSATPRVQMNVRLHPDLVAAADADRAALGLSRDRYVESVLTAHLTGRPTGEPDPAAALAEAAALAARIRGDAPVTVNL